MVDKRDFAIMAALDANARQSNSQIARKVKLSKDVVTYRIKKLEREGVITGYYANINGAAVGNKYYKLLLRFQRLGKEKEQQLISWLKSRHQTVWIGSCDGRWNLIVTLAVQDLKELDQYIDELFLIFGDEFQEKQIFVVKSVNMFNEKYLYSKGEFKYRQHTDLTLPSAELDEKDRIILAALAKNARIAATDLAKKVALTPEAVAKRIKNLVKSKIILGFKPRINFTKLGNQYYHIFLSVKNSKNLQEILNYYTHHFGCVAILEHLGFYDIHLEFVVESNQILRDILVDLRDKFGDAIVQYEPLAIYAEYVLIPLPSK